MNEELKMVVSTAVSVGVAIAAAATWAFKATIARDVTPLMVELRMEASALTREFASYRSSKDEERRELRGILNDVDKIVQNHETRITVLELDA